jgi:hypothetical protein
MEKTKRFFLIWCILDAVSGIAVAWVDSQPNWDDAGISALLIFLCAGIFGYLASRKPWIIALAAGIWIPLFGIVSTHNYGGMLAIIPGFIGAYAGFFIRKSTGNS